MQAAGRGLFEATNYVLQWPGGEPSHDPASRHGGETRVWRVPQVRPEKRENDALAEWYLANTRTLFTRWKASGLLLCATPRSLKVGKRKDGGAHATRGIHAKLIPTAPSVGSAKDMCKYWVKYSDMKHWKWDAPETRAYATRFTTRRLPMARVHLPNRPLLRCRHARHHYFPQHPRCRPLLKRHSG